MEKIKNYRAKFQDGQYEVWLHKDDPAPTWVSYDGDWWFDENFKWASGVDFENCSIRLCGGPRDGVIVGRG
jgi:hypothetical protein